MKLSKREQILLIILSLVVLIIGYFKFIILPINSRIKDAQSVAVMYNENLTSTGNKENIENQLNNKLIDATKEFNEITREYFLNLKQEEIIFILNDLLESSGLNAPSINFSKSVTEDHGDIKLTIMSTNLPYEGEYEELVNFLENISNYNKKITIKNIIINTGEEGVLTGNIVIDFYSLSGSGGYEGVIEWNNDIENNRNNPFKPFIDYNLGILDDSYGEESITTDDSFINLDNVKITFGDSKVNVINFEDDNLYFVSSHNNGKGTILKDTNSIRGDYSARLDYSFYKGEGEKKVYIKIKEGTINETPLSIGLWIYSYETSSDSIFMTLDNMGGFKDTLMIAEDIDWIGWKEFKVVPPQDKGLYPLKVSDIFILNNSPYQSSGAILVDNIEAYYKTLENSVVLTNKEGYKPNNTDTKSEVGSEYTSYVVKPGDTLFKITRELFNNTSLIDTIIKINNIKDITNIEVGEILKIPKIN